MTRDSDVLSDQGASDGLVYLAIGPCGCGYGIDTEDNEDGQGSAKRWLREGATVTRVPIAEARDRIVLNCPHTPAYGLLGASDARAEVVRLRRLIGEAYMQRGTRPAQALRQLFGASRTALASDEEDSTHA